MRKIYKILAGEPEGNRQLEKLGIDGRSMLKWILKKQGVRV